jgi:hypothetical protein
VGAVTEEPGVGEVTEERGESGVTEELRVGEVTDEAGPGTRRPTDEDNGTEPTELFDPTRRLP